MRVRTESPAAALPRRFRNAAGVLPFIAPVHFMLLIVIVLPAVYVIWLSLSTSTFGRAPVFVGLANYVKVLVDPAFRSALLNTAIIVIVAVHLELLIALGPVTMALRGLGLPILDWTFVPSHALAIIILLTIWLQLPFTFVIIYAARLAIPKQLYEAAMVDGAAKLQIFRHVTLPLLAPAILIALLFRYIFAFRLFSEVWLMTEGGPARSTEVVATYLYEEAFRYNAFGTAAATAWIMVIISLLLAAAYVLLLRRQDPANAH